MLSSLINVINVALTLGLVSASPLLSRNAAWVMDVSLANYTPSGSDWTNPIATIGEGITPALHDLQRDWYKVIGVPPTVLSAFPTGTWDGDCVVVFAMAPPGAFPAESFTVVASSSGPVPCTLTVTGADPLGVIFGTFHVSADFLGVDPMWYFNDVVPAYEPAGITVDPTYSYSSGAPTFTSRGAFNNDEDLSGYFFSSPLGDSVYSPDFANRFCEALLRLRCNTFIPSTFAYIDESHYRVAAARGLRLGNHHVMPLGNNVFAWPKGVSYAYRLNPGPFHAVWGALADYQQREQGRSMVYSLGYRGVNDEPFWNMDTQCKTVQCQGATISQAIANQSAIALATPYVNRPQFVAYMWMELLALKEAGTLVLPPNVSCVWTDFPGAFLFRDGFANVTKNDGFYGHISMMNGQAGQLTEFIPLARMFANIWEFVVRGATAYGMINLSDLKFVPLTAEAVYRYLWSPASFNVSSACLHSTTTTIGSRDPVTGRRGHLGAWPMPNLSPNSACSSSGSGAKGGEVGQGIVTPTQAQDAFVLEFSTRHYGPTAGPTAAALYGQYFNISYMAIAVPGQATKADHYLGGQLRTLLSHFSASDNGLPAAAKECGDVARDNLPFVTQLYVNGVVPLGATLPPGPYLRFFQSHLAAQSAIHYYHLVAFSTGAAGANALMAGSVAGAIANLTLALQAMDDLMAVLRVAEGTGVWHGSYAADGWTWVWGSRQTIAHTLAKLGGKVIASAPSNPYPDYAIMTYETDAPNPPTGTPTFPFANFNASVAFDLVPRFACSQDIPPPPSSSSSSSTGPAWAAPVPSAADTCTSTWVGVTLKAPSLVGFFTAPYKGPGARTSVSAIHYTVDGSTPTVGSPTYTAPFTLSAPCTVRAMSFDEDTGVALSTETAADVSM